MNLWTRLASYIWRQYETDGVPASGPHKPVISEIRTWGTETEAAFEARAWFARVRAVATSNLSISSDLQNGDSVDGVTLATGDLVLLTGQTTASQNGIYVVVASGAASRHPAFSAYDDIAGLFISVTEGSVYGNTLWQCVSNVGGTIDVTALSFSQFVGGGSGSGDIARKMGALTPHENLRISQASVSSVSALADAVLLFDSSGTSKRFENLNETIAITASGVNGLDTGSEASSTWYYIWAIGKSDGTLDGLLSISSTSPTMPSGYTFKGLIGAVRNDGSSNFVDFHQYDRLVLGKRVAILSTGTATTFTAVSLASVVPPIANQVLLEMFPWSTTGSNKIRSHFTPDPAESGSSNSSPIGYNTFGAFSIDNSGAIVTAWSGWDREGSQIFYRVTGTNGANDMAAGTFMY